MEADSTSDKLPAVSSDTRIQEVPTTDLSYGCEDTTQPALQSADIALDHQCDEPSMSGSMEPCLHTESDSSSPSTQFINATMSSQLPASDITDNVTSVIVTIDLPEETRHTLQIDNGCLSGPTSDTSATKDCVSSCDSKSDMNSFVSKDVISCNSNDSVNSYDSKDNVGSGDLNCKAMSQLEPSHEKDAEANSNETEKQEEEELFIESVAETTKFKVLKKYFGDTRKPGILHRPHVKRNYGSFKCKECYLSFHYRPSLIFHKHTHRNKHHLYECCKCSYKSSAPGAYTQHELTHHPDQLYQCKACNLTFLQRSTLNRHKAANHQPHKIPQDPQSSHSFVCNFCPAILSSKCDMTAHLKSNHNIADSSNSLTEESHAEAGQQTKAVKQQVYYQVIPHYQRMSSKHEIKCKYCKQMFPVKGPEYNQHLQSVDKSVAWAKTSCPWCSFIGNSPCHLAHHKRKFHMCCLLCNKQYSHKDLLKQHMISFHRGVMKHRGIGKVREPQTVQQKQPPTQCMPQHQCTICKIKCFSESSLCQHMKHSHELDKNPPNNLSNEAVQHWYCMTCKVIFPTKRFLDLHIKLNHRPMKILAEDCQEQQNDDKRQWRCILCNTLHETLRECDKHLIRIHPDEYEYCSRNEIAEPTLPIAISALPDTEAPYTCNMCDCKVTSSDLLHKHKEEFHRVAYSISITQELKAKKRTYRCRYRCGYTDCLYMNITKHEVYCAQKVTPKSKIILPTAVLDPSTGKLITKYPDVISSDSSPHQSIEHQDVKLSLAGQLTDPGAIQQAEVSSDQNMIKTEQASVSSIQNVNEKQQETICTNQNVVEKQQASLSSNQNVGEKQQASVSCNQDGGEKQQVLVSSNLNVSDTQHASACINQNVNKTASVDKCQDITTSTGNVQLEAIKPLSNNQQTIQPQQKQIIKLPLAPEQPVKSSMSSNTTIVSAHKNPTIIVLPTGSNKSIKSTNTGYFKKDRLPVYGKHDLVSSSSDDDSDCSWLDRSSDSDDDDNDKSPDFPSSDDEGVKDVPIQGSQSSIESKKVNPVTSSTITSCPPLLQPTVLMRFFQAIDMSDLYRLALQMITGSPQPHTLPTSDPLMDEVRTASFKYKIPMGYSHKEFQDMPLFPSSREVMRIDYMQTLPSKHINKHYKSVLAKPYVPLLTSLIDSAVITHVKGNVLKGVERFVRKQRVDDRKDITLSLSQYIVSQYYKNQQKKSSSQQPSSLGISLATGSGNSPGAGPSHVKTGPSANGLQASSPTLIGSSTSRKRVVTVNKFASATSKPVKNGPPKQSNIQVSSKQPEIVGSDRITEGTTAKNALKFMVGQETTSEGEGSEKKNEKSIQITAVHKEKDTIKVVPGWKNKKSPAKSKPEKEQSVPTRRSSRLLRNLGQQSGDDGEDVTVSVNSYGQRYSGKRTSSLNQTNHKLRSEVKKSKVSKQNKNDDDDDEDDRDSKSVDESCQENNPDDSKLPTKQTQKNSCKDNQSLNTDTNRSDRNNPKSCPPSSKTTFLTKQFSTVGTISRTGPSKVNHTVQVHSNNETHDGNHDLMLHVPQEGSLQELYLDPKFQNANMVASTIERDGVIQITRHPLHGLNGSTMQRHIATNPGSYHITRETVPLNGKTYLGKTESVNVENISIPERSKLPVDVTTKASESVAKRYSLRTRDVGPLDDSVLQLDDASNKKHVPSGCEEMIQTAFRSLPRKEHLPLIGTTPQTQNGYRNNCTGHTWKKTVSKEEVLEQMAKRKTWKCAPYKTGNLEDISMVDTGGERESTGITRVSPIIDKSVCSDKDQMNQDTFTYVTDTRQCDSPDSHKTRDCVISNSTDRIICEDDMSGNASHIVCLSDKCVSRQQMIITHKRRAPSEPLSTPDKILCIEHNQYRRSKECLQSQGRDIGINNCNESNKQQMSEESEITATQVERKKVQIIVSAKEDEVETALQTKDSFDEESVQESDEEKDSSNDLIGSTSHCIGTDHFMKDSTTTGEQIIRRKSLRHTSMDLKRKKDADTNHVKKKKSTIDHSYIKTPRSDNRNKGGKTKGAGTRRGPQSESARMQTGEDRLKVPHDHSYTSTKKIKITPNSNTDKMDHCYYWRTLDGPKGKQEDTDGYKQQRDTKVTRTQGDTGQPRQPQKQQDTCCVEEHSYSNTTLKYKQDKMTSMDHCYVRITPMKYNTRQQDERIRELSHLDDKAHTEQRERKTLLPIKNGSSQVDTSKHTSCDRSPDGGSEGTLLRRALRPRRSKDPGTGS